MYKVINLITNGKGDKEEIIKEFIKMGLYKKIKKAQNENTVPNNLN